MTEKKNEETHKKTTKVQKIRATKTVEMEIAIVMVIIGMLLGGVIGRYVLMPGENTSQNVNNSITKPDYGKLNGIVNAFNKIQMAYGKNGDLKLGIVNPAVCFNLTENGTPGMFGCTQDYNTIVMGTQNSVITMDNINKALSQIDKTKNSKSTANTNSIAKENKPDVQLYIMSHSPGGIQTQRAIIPVLRLLGNKIIFEPKFVYYVMHGKNEVYDNTVEYCVNKLEPSKYLDFLTCYLNNNQNQNDSLGNMTKCVENIGMNINKIEQCVNETDTQYNLTEMYEDNSTWIQGRYPRYTIYEKDNKKYGVIVSPTLIVNGKTVNVNSMSPESIKEAICNRFTTKPPECNVKLNNVLN